MIITEQSTFTRDLTMSNNGKPRAVDVAETAPYIPRDYITKKKSFITTVAAIIIVFIFAFLGGMYAGRILWVNEPKTQEKKDEGKKAGVAPEKKNNIEKKFIASDWRKEILFEADLLAEQRLRDILSENLLGVFIIKDDEAQTVRYKQASIANRTGFTDLKKDSTCFVRSYFIYQETGYGVCDMGENKLFLLIWQTGKNKPPATNPYRIHIISGIHVRAGLFLP